MKEYPILFTDFMVQANHAGRKRMTRRVVALNRLKVVMRREVRSDLPAFIRPTLVAPKAAKLPATLNPYGAVSCVVSGGALGLKPGEFDFVCPYAQGETVMVREGEKNTWTIIPHESRVWVREKWAVDASFDDLAPRALPVRGMPVFFHASAQCFDYRWRPSIHMPRWACRDVYTVTKVRLERLQDITEVDATAEGMQLSLGDTWCGAPHKANGFPRVHNTTVEAFADLWNHLYGTWTSNPWVWVVEYDNPLWVQP